MELAVQVSFIREYEWLNSVWLEVIASPAWLAKAPPKMLERFIVEFICVTG